MTTTKKFWFYLFAIVGTTFMLFSSCEKDDDDNNNGLTNTVTDVDGNVYATVIIGTQEWMAENLRTTKYNDGTPVPTGHSNNDWAALTTGAYAVYPHAIIDGLNSEAEVLEAYGALYNWYAVETGNLCPSGWRVPTDAEWYAMENYVDPTINDPNATGWRGTDGGTKLKATSGWYSGGNGTDIYGFSALPGGFRSYHDGNFGGVGYLGYWWSSTEDDAPYAWDRGMDYDVGNVHRGNYDKRDGSSVRCLRDN